MPRVSCVMSNSHHEDPTILLESALSYKIAKQQQQQQQVSWLLVIDQ